MVSCSMFCKKHGIDDGALVCGPNMEEHAVAVDVAWLIIVMVNRDVVPALLFRSARSVQKNHNYSFGVVGV